MGDALSTARPPPPPPPPASSDLMPPASCGVIFACIAIFLTLLLRLQTRVGVGQWLPHSGEKREYEVWVLKYSPVWMGAFAIIIAFELYEQFDAFSYFKVCGGLALPLALQPFLWPSRACPSVWASHALRAQLWLMIFGFIGNYWYTHYFYCVLRARYTMPAWRLNDVPIAMYFATHFYFSSYHVLANLPLRYIRTAFRPGAPRTLLFIAVVLAMSYATAFMETLTISNFPYYSFENRSMAYSIGSAFYGIYFIVSFPMYFSLDEHNGPQPMPGPSLLEAALHAFAAGMLVLLLLDFVRLSVAGVPLNIGGLLWEVTES